MKSAMQQVFGQLVGHGITSIGSILQTDEEGPGGKAGELESVGMMIFAEDMVLGNHAILCGDPARAVDARASSSLHQPHQNRVVGGVKLFLDGTLGGRSACLHRPYADAPHQKGWLTIDPAVAAARMEAIHLAGLQVCVHAIGDAANSVALDLFADLLARHPVTPGQGPRHRIEHASVLDEAAAERFAELGVVAVVQPPFLTSEVSWLADRVGPERSPRTYAFRTLLDAGVTLAGSSDAPLESPDVLAGMAAAVTRHGFEPTQAITAAEAIEMYTRGGAIAQQREHLTGSLVAGHRADMVVLSHDPTTTPPERVADIEVRVTVIGGGVVHQV
jgi:predicted amidohydrolase YtcJ